ncbi:MAG: phosphate transport system permease protein [Actinomycetota bacterium]|jgi:phosphate transport system permease protein
MSTAAIPAPSLQATDTSRSRKLRNHLATGFIWATFLAAALPLAFIVFYVVRAGMRLFSYDFLVTNIPIISAQPGPGMAPAVVGTLLITGAATAIAVPLGVLGAVYLNEYGRRGALATFIRLMTDVMSGVPSVVMGLFIYTIWVLRYGLSGFAGALALACLMLPIIVRTSEEMLRLVPAGLREASAALGCRTWRTTVRIVLPAALPGIVSGAMLAVARAAGETAPLLFTIGVVSKPNTSLFGANTALSAQIFKNAQVPFPAAQDRAWAAALTLILLVFVLTLAARVVSARFARK